MYCITQNAASFHCTEQERTFSQVQMIWPADPMMLDVSVVDKVLGKASG